MWDQFADPKGRRSEDLRGEERTCSAQGLVKRRSASMSVPEGLWKKAMSLLGWGLNCERAGKRGGQLLTVEVPRHTSGQHQERERRT